MGRDIGNAYLEAFTDEKLYIVAGPEFQELDDRIPSTTPGADHLEMPRILVQLGHIQRT